MIENTAQVFQKRRAGLLLHISSLPEGNLGKHAYYFIDFLKKAGFSVWQMLPIGPTSYSPYQCYSAHAGNLDFIDWQAWQEELQIEQPYPLTMAYQLFKQKAAGHWIDVFEKFKQERQYWLKDYCTFVSLKEHFNGQPWWEWPEAVRLRNPDTLTEYQNKLAQDIDAQAYGQFVFCHQWQNVKHYANERGISLFGDMPIFVAHDSADVWSHPEAFKMDKRGNLISVAGVPPDYFSATGQRWGNPHYDWDQMKQDNFTWWQERMASQLICFDIIRIDHFRGFEAFWEIPASEPTAVNGHWVKAPGQALFQTLYNKFKDLPLVAEDLGIITEEVDKLRLDFNLPGMKVLHFAFDKNPNNPYLPHNHEKLSVAYTGTHDNDTTVGWYQKLNEEYKQFIHDYLSYPQESMPWTLIRSTLASVSSLAVIPMQDLLELGSEHRMNTPGTTDGNWRWRFGWEQVSPEVGNRIRHLLYLYNRLVD